MFKRAMTRTAGTIRVTPANKKHPNGEWKIIYSKGKTGGFRLCRDAAFTYVPGIGYLPTQQTVDTLSHACAKYNLNLNSVINAAVSSLSQQTL